MFDVCDMHVNVTKKNRQSNSINWNQILWIADFLFVLQVSNF